MAELVCLAVERNLDSPLSGRGCHGRGGSTMANGTIKRLVRDRGLRVHSRRRRAGVVFPPQLGQSGQLRTAQRGAARQFRRGTVSERTASGKYPLGGVRTGSRLPHPGKAGPEGPLRQPTSTRWCQGPWLPQAELHCAAHRRACKRRACAQLQEASTSFGCSRDASTTALPQPMRPAAAPVTWIVRPASSRAAAHIPAR